MVTLPRPRSSTKGASRAQPETNCISFSAVRIERGRETAPMNRRQFVHKAGLAAAALPFAALDEVKLPFEVAIHSPRVERSPMGMPGIFPGRVIEVRDELAIVEGRISEE